MLVKAGCIWDRAPHVGTGVSKDDCGTKIDELDDVAACEDAVVELEISMCETQRMEIGNTIAYLSKDAKYLWTKHLGGHDDGEEVVWCIFHDLFGIRRGCRERSQGKYLVVVTMIADDVDGFNDIDVFQAGADTELCSHLLLVFAFRFACATRTELLHSIYCASRLGTTANETDCSTCTGAKYTAPLAILF